MTLSPILIFANGKASRMGAKNPFPKTLCEIDGRTVLESLLTEIGRSGDPEKVVIFLRKSVPAISDLIANTSLPVELRFAEPTGYFTDLNVWRKEQTTAFSVLDSDLVAPPGSVRNFLLSANRDIGDSGVAVGYTPDDTAGHDRTTWVAFDPSGWVRRFERGIPSTGFSSVGAFHWSPDAFHAADEFLEHSVSVTSYIGALVERGYPVLPLPVAGAINVNTLEDLADARRRARAWLGER